MRVAFALLALVVAAPAWASGSAADAAARGTLYGVLERGPTKPVCEADEPCEAPAPGVRLRFLRAGRLVATVVTGRGGAYRVRLPAATYAVRTSARPFGTIPTPPTARVVAGRSRRIDFLIDTGIR
jgi:hypothetical protein